MTAGVVIISARTAWLIAAIVLATILVGALVVICRAGALRPMKALAASVALSLVILVGVCWAVLL